MRLEVAVRRRGMQKVIVSVWKGITLPKRTTFPSVDELPSITAKDEVWRAFPTKCPLAYAFDVVVFWIMNGCWWHGTRDPRSWRSCIIHPERTLLFSRCDALPRLSCHYSLCLPIPGGIIKRLLEINCRCCWLLLLGWLWCAVPACNGFLTCGFLTASSFCKQSASITDRFSLSVEVMKTTPPHGGPIGGSWINLNDAGDWAWSGTFQPF